MVALATDGSDISQYPPSIPPHTAASVVPTSPTSHDDHNALSQLYRWNLSSSFKVFTFHHDEEELLADWAAYHGAIFGPENVFIVDHGSVLPAVKATLQSLRMQVGDDDRQLHTLCMLYPIHTSRDTASSRLLPALHFQGFQIAYVPDGVDGWVQGKALSLIMNKVAKRHKRTKLLILLDVSHASYRGFTPHMGSHLIHIPRVMSISPQSIHVLT